jgi:hypothetical protein
MRDLSSKELYLIAGGRAAKTQDDGVTVTATVGPDPSGNPTSDNPPPSSGGDGGGGGSGGASSWTDSVQVTPNHAVLLPGFEVHSTTYGVVSVMQNADLTLGFYAQSGSLIGEATADGHGGYYLGVMDSTGHLDISFSASYGNNNTSVSINVAYHF